MVNKAKLNKGYLSNIQFKIAFKNIMDISRKSNFIYPQLIDKTIKFTGG